MLGTTQTPQPCVVNPPGAELGTHRRMVQVSQINLKFHNDLNRRVVEHLLHQFIQGTALFDATAWRAASLVDTKLPGDTTLHHTHIHTHALYTHTDSHHPLH